MGDKCFVPKASNVVLFIRVFLCIVGVCVEQLGGVLLSFKKPPGKLSLYYIQQELTRKPFILINIVWGTFVSTKKLNTIRE